MDRSLQSHAHGNITSKASAVGVMGLFTHTTCRHLFKAGLFAVVAFMVLPYVAAATDSEAAIDPAPPTQPDNFIEYDSATQEFTASVHNKPFNWVTKNLKKAAGIEFKVSKDDYAPVSAQFENQPLEQAIRQLLYGTSHLIISDDVTKIIVLSSRNEAVHASVSMPGTANQPVPSGETELAETPLQDFKRYLIESTGDEPEFDDLRAQLEEMPEIELNEEQQWLQQNPDQSQIANTLLKNLFQAATNLSGQ